MKDSLKIAVAGATGYVGLELVKILSKHPKIKILYLCAKKSVGKSIYTFDRNIKNKRLPKISSFKKIDLKKIDVIFTALPNGEAQKIACKIPEKFNKLTSLEFSKLLLEEADIAVSPGLGFGEYGEGFVRLSMVENEQRIRQAARNLRKIIK